MLCSGRGCVGDKPVKSGPGVCVCVCVCVCVRVLECHRICPNTLSS